MGEDNFFDNVGDVVEDIKNSTYLEIGGISIGLIIIGFIGVLILPSIAPLITAFFAILGNVGVGMAIFYLIDRFVLKSIDTILEIKKGNIACAILVLSIMILIGAAIIAT